jgi:hypothetical protein
VGIVAKILRQESLLNVAGNADFLLETLALPLAFDQAGIVENACCVGGEGIQNLAVELRECSRAPRIQLENAKKIAALDIDQGLIGICARHGIKRNDDDRA